MKLIVGLGNPGQHYAETRHNVGADIISVLANKIGLQINRTSLKSEWGRGNINGYPVIFAKPLTYMNLSGEAVLALKHYFKIDINDILVVTDDFSLSFGKLRFRGKGSAGGHNGLKSIGACLGTQDFQRLKVGIDKPLANLAITDFVLGRFPQEQRDQFESVAKSAGEAILNWIQYGLDDSMRKFH